MVRCGQHGFLASWLAGAPLNVALNIAIVLLILAPLWLMDMPKTELAA